MEDKNPLVSVIMNCYNGEEYLREAIDSVYAQTYVNWEIVFLDNVSTDNSADIAHSYDNKLKYFSSESNEPLGKVRVYAVNKAKGKYITFLDCDDIWCQDKLERQVNLMLSTVDVGVVYSRTEMISDNGSNIGYLPNENEELLGGDVFSDLVKLNFIPFVSAMVDIEKYYECGGFPDGYKHSTDYFLFLNIAYKYKVLADSSVLCKYRVHDNNLSKAHYILDAEESIRAVENFFPDKRAVQGVKYQYLNLAIAYLKEYKAASFIKLIISKWLFPLFVVRVLKKVGLLR